MSSTAFDRVPACREGTIHHHARDLRQPGRGQQRHCAAERFAEHEDPL